jgi:mitochondrial fission protein ELM1
MKTYWGITDGSAGMSAQVQALAGALGINVQMKKVRIKRSAVWLPNTFFDGPTARLIVPYLLEKGSDRLEAPWPDMVITCGRRAAIAALGLKAHIGKEAPTRFLHIQDPQVRPQNFDLIVAMEHDRIRAPNVIKSPYALHKITPSLLENARMRFEPRFRGYPYPLVAVMLGGSTNKYTLTENAMGKVIDELNNLLENIEGTLLITPSRRTGERNVTMLEHAFSHHPRVYIYDGKEENPYMGLLAMADHLVVSNDSVNMMSEARATGKPLYILTLPGHKGTKPARFAQRLKKEGSARLLGNVLESWNYEVRDDMARLAIAVRERLSGL